MVATSPSVTVRRVVLASQGQPAARADRRQLAVRAIVRRILELGAWLAAMAVLEVALLLVAAAITAVV